jgi:hypothetical protein
VCTVSIVPGASGFRMVCNRDELRTRPVALPPRLHRTQSVTAVWPVDPKSGGTWVAANDAGLAVALLNRTAPAGHWRSAPGVSRGTIIPRLSASTSLSDALDRALALRIGEMDAFTLVVVEGSSVGTVTSIGGRLSLRTVRLRAPVVFTSSSLGDCVVQEPRSKLFQRLVECSQDPFTGQAQFHRHRWPLRPEISIEMSRADASTVSRTIVDVLPNKFTLRYTPVYR